jgi:predicted N-formylglutamate amidohydrolase
MEAKVYFTVEHASDKIPKEYSHLNKRKELVGTHWSCDIGALDVAKKLSKHFKAPLLKSAASRLIIDCNRSPMNKKALFARHPFTLSHNEKEEIKRKYYYPYWNKGIREIKSLLKNYKVLSISVHSFTPVLKGIKRNNDIALLYRPWVKEEKSFCHLWVKEIKKLKPYLKIRFNYPYTGASDCFINHCSDREFTDRKHFLGIFLEINQKNMNSKKEEITNTLIFSLEQAIKKHPWFR